jgi:hypothetical protein
VHHTHHRKYCTSAERCAGCSPAQQLVYATAERSSSVHASKTTRQAADPRGQFAVARGTELLVPNAATAWQDEQSVSRPDVDSSGTQISMRARATHSPFLESPRPAVLVHLNHVQQPDRARVAVLSRDRIDDRNLAQSGGPTKAAATPKKQLPAQEIDRQMQREEEVMALSASRLRRPVIAGLRLRRVTVCSNRIRHQARVCKPGHV